MNQSTIKNLIKKLAFILVFANSLAFAQIKIDKSKKLIVVTLEEKLENLERLSKKHKAEHEIVYKGIISTYNNSIKELVEKHLPSFSSIEYMTLSQFHDDVYYKKIKNTYVLSYNNPTNMTSNILTNDNGNGGGGTWIHTNLDNIKGLDSTNILDFSIIEFGEFDAKGQDYTKIMVKNLYGLPLSKGELVYAISQIGKECKGAQNTSEKNKEIKSKTLIINADYLEKKITETEIAKVYPHKFKIVSNYEFQKQLSNQDGTTLCLMVVPLVKTAMPIGPITKTSIAYFHIIYDPLNFNSYIVSYPSGMIGMSNINEKISLSQLKSFAKDWED